MDWQAIALSFELAALTTAVLLLVGLPIGYYIATSARRPLRVLVEAVVALPLVLPPTVLGFYVLLALGPRSPIGAFYESVTGRLLPFSFQGLLVASVLYSLPFSVQPFASAFSAVDSRLLDASFCLGESRFRTFLRVTLPLSWQGVVTGMVLSFAHTLGEFGVVLMVGGNVPGVTRTVSISIYDAMQSLDYGLAGRTSAFLLVLSFLVLAATYALQGGAFSPWSKKS